MSAMSRSIAGLSGSCRRRGERLWQGRVLPEPGDDAPLLVGTSNTDGRGAVRTGDDRLMRAG